MHSLVNVDKMKEIVKTCKKAGCKITRNIGAGTVVATDGEKVVLQAMQKGRGGPWIAKFVDSERVQWIKPE